MYYFITFCLQAVLQQQNHFKLDIILNGLSSDRFTKIATAINKHVYVLLSVCIYVFAELDRTIQSIFFSIFKVINIRMV